MRCGTMHWGWWTLVALAGSLVTRPLEAQNNAAEGKGLIAQARLPKLNGGTLQGTMIEVTYGPDGRSAAHRHPCPVFAYVADGSVRSGLGDGPMEVFTAGHGWYEAPMTRHRSENASTTAPARLVAFFVCDTRRPLVLPEAGRARQVTDAGGRQVNVIQCARERRPRAFPESL